MSRLIVFRSTARSSFLPKLSSPSFCDEERGYFDPVRKFNRGAPSPQFGEFIHTAHFGHDVHTHPQRFGMLTPKMDGMSAPERFHGERRDGDGVSLKFSQRPAQKREIDGVRNDGEVSVAAKLGDTSGMNSPCLPFCLTRLFRGSPETSWRFCDD